ncbi:MAG: tRNA glutamyl-Q(34) synthetase GluQRS [Ilumatobacteraceae bacterium]
MRGRFAPSPTGPLHVGNLRTALAAWLSARSQHGGFLVRMDDLDPVTSSPVHAAGQLADLDALGLIHDGAVVSQSARFDLYREAITRLDAQGLVYSCFCTRREIREAAAAPHGAPLPDGAYPGTCRSITAAQRRDHERAGRPMALRLLTHGEVVAFDDVVYGRFEGAVDDVVLQRNDGVPAYNLATVVDDHLQGVTEVVRGDDLLSSTPRQIHLQRLLGFDQPVHAHVPLVLGADGERLAKRHGAVTLADMAAARVDVTGVLAMLGHSIGLCDVDEPVTADGLVERFRWADVPRDPWTFRPAS